MSRNQITDIRAREIFDCRWIPTVQVEIDVDGRLAGVGNAPIGKSTGSEEAFEIRDGGKRYRGYGCLQAVRNIETEIKERLMGMDVTQQRAIDHAMMALDGTENKSRLGANAILPVSVAAAIAGAKVTGLPLYRYLNHNAHILPVPLLDMLSGGLETDFSAIEIQEFCIFPIGAQSFSEAMEIGHEVHYQLLEIMVKKYGQLASIVSLDGGFSCVSMDIRENLDLLVEAVEKAGCSEKVKYGFDMAATHWYDKESKLYTLEGKKRTTEELLEIYRGLIRDYPILTMEDPFDETDVNGFVRATKELGIQIVGDDFFVTNPKILKEKMALGGANAMLWKYNQIGTLTQAFDAAQIAFRNGYGVMVSERNGETEDSTLADLVVALDGSQVKTGNVNRSERVAKYNRLLQIEKELGSEAVYAGEFFQNGYMK
ncbi:MAG: phosphopyruvate hydratase [Anaerotruncus sp.]|nr:phosphopyruvate hydratase [Anaerotruncus sp.]